jgi:cysteine-rich repeat protein
MTRATPAPTARSVCRPPARPRLAAAILGVAAALTTAPASSAAQYVVAGAGGDFTTIQAALDAAVAGDTILVRERATPYAEKIVFPRSGDATAGHIILQRFPGENPVLDGSGVPGSNMVLIEDRSWVKLVGFEIRNNLGVNDGSGVRILGAGTHIEIRDNRIHDIRGQHAMGITVYATSPTEPIADLVIDGNEIYDCEPYQSEALTLNGNVTDFAVTNNVVRDVNNIGIDFIGGETDINPDPTKVARNGVCRGNRVTRAREAGGGYAAGIYVDGGRDLVIENNLVTGCDVGMEIGAENRGIVVSGVVVRNNLLYANEKAGLAFGGYASSRGRVRGARFLNNTLYQNDTLGVGFGELWIQYAEDNEVRNNLVFAGAGNVLLASDAGNVNNTLDHNLWYAAAGAAAACFSWNGASHTGFAAYRAATGQDGASLFADPLLVAPAAADFHLSAASPARNAGDPAFIADPVEVDLDGGPRVNGPRVDIGADEGTTCGDGAVDPGEACDDGDLENGDGCDANCTPTGCGNRVVTAGEQCDDGNLAAGDCCSPACQHEPAGAPCDDADPCTQADGCSLGACAGIGEPRAACRAPATSTVLLGDRPGAARDTFDWKWVEGDATVTGDFGDPAGGATRYALCVYDQPGGAWRVRLRATARSAGTCGGRPCWKALGADGFRYTDREQTPGGLRSLVLRARETAAARLTVKVKGAGLPGPPLAQEPAVAVQLTHSGGACWGVAYPAPAARNDVEQFRDKLE